MNFCSNCGSPVESKIPAGDHLPRFVCTSCNMVHYKNPLLVLGCVPEWQNKILLCRRAIEPRLGFWTVPAGFMENGETMQQAAARECQEEALAEVEVGSLLAVVSVTRANQVHVMFRAKLLRAEIRAGTGEFGGRRCTMKPRFRGPTWHLPAANLRCGNTSRTAAPGARIIISPN